MKKDKPEQIVLLSRETVKPMDKVTRAIEIGGPKGPEPTRYGDWERKGRCSDF